MTRSTRPDPHRVARKPMAHVDRQLLMARRPGEKATVPALLDPDENVDLAALCQLIDASEALTEGEVEVGTVAVSNGPGRTPTRTFLGSMMLTVDLASTGAKDLARAWPSVVAAFKSDARVRRMVQDRAFRETARLLGSSTPSDLEYEVSVRTRGEKLLIDVEIEGRVDPKNLH